MHNHILMQFMSYSIWKGFLQTNSSHDFKENVIINALLHGWQQFNVYWLMKVLEQYFFGNDLIVFANVLLSDQQLFNTQKFLQFVSPLQLSQSRKIVCLQSINEYRCIEKAVTYNKSMKQSDDEKNELLVFPTGQPNYYESHSEGMKQQQNSKTCLRYMLQIFRYFADPLLKDRPFCSVLYRHGIFGQKRLLISGQNNHLERTSILELAPTQQDWRRQSHTLIIDLQLKRTFVLDLFEAVLQIHFPLSSSSDERFIYCYLLS